MASALIVVDLQNDFVTGSLAVPGAEQVVTSIVNHIEVGDKSHGQQGLTYPHIVTTQDWHIDPGDHWSDTPDFVDSWPVHCEAGTWGAQFHEDFYDIADSRVDGFFVKGMYDAAYSGFEAENGEDTLHGFLHRRGVTSIYVVGLALDHCVRATALDGVRNGYNVTVLTGMTAGITKESSQAAIEEMRNAGINIV